MKVEQQTSRNFLSDDGRLGILIELVDAKIVHITLARKGASGLVELTEAQMEQLSEIIPAATEFIRGLKPQEAQG